MAKAAKLPSGNWRAVAFVGTDENRKKIRKNFTAPPSGRFMRSTVRKTHI